jgi:hypothetical protein
MGDAVDIDSVAEEKRDWESRLNPVHGLEFRRTRSWHSRGFAAPVASQVEQSRRRSPDLVWERIRTRSSRARISGAEVYHRDLGEFRLRVS